MRSRALLVCVASLALADMASAQSSSLARQIADGQPWNMRRADSGESRLTLNPDGTSRMQMGPRSMQVGWREVPGGMCIKPPTGAERCVNLRREGAAVIGVREGRDVFRLTR